MKLLTLLFFLTTLTVSAQDSVYHKFFLKTPVFRPGQAIPAKTEEQLVDVELPANKVYTLVEVDMSPVVIQANQPSTQGGITIAADYIGSTDAGDFVSYAAPLLGKTKVKIEYSRQWDTPSQGSAEVRATSPTGPILGTIITPNTGAWTTFSTVQTNISASNANTVFIVFKTTGTGNIKNITFE